MEFYKVERPLTDEAIYDIRNELSEIYSKAVGKRSIGQTKFSLALEEMLVRFQECYGKEIPCKIIFAKKISGYSIEFSQQGNRKPWITADEEEQISYDMLGSLGVNPRYTYSSSGKGCNRVIWESIVTPKKLTMLQTILIAVVLAVFAGLLINSASANLHNLITDELITPVFTKLTTIFAAIATPLVFFAVIQGIVGIGDVKSFGIIGSKVLKRMGGSYCVSALLIGIGCFIAYGMSVGKSAGGDGSVLGQIVKMVLDIVPDNLLMPFTIDNDLQVIVIAIFAGVTILILGTKISALRDVIKDCTELVNKMMMLCCKLLPAIVFFGVVKIISTSNSKQFISIAKMLGVYFAINIVFMLSMVIRARIVTKVPLKSIIPKQLATLMINITTSSQVAALPENMKCCKEKFGIESKLVDFGLPLGIVVYMPSGGIFLGVTAWALAIMSGSAINAGIMIRILLVSVILAVAAPPIPGSAFVVLPILMASCGIPNDMFPLAVIFATIIGYILPAANGFNIQLELLMTAKKLKMVNEEKLKAVYKEKK